MNMPAMLQLISIIIAINALVVMFFVWVIDKDRKLLLKNVSELKLHIEYTESVIDSMIEWLIVRKKIASVEQGWLYKHMREEEGKDYSERFRKNTEKIRNESRKNIQEVMLHSNNKVRKESAYKQLCHAYGDIETCDIMIKLSKMRREDKKYKVYVKKLKQRLQLKLQDKYL